MSRSPQRRRGRQSAGGDRGSAAVELTLLTPLIVLLLLLIVYAGRAVNARGQVDTAAHTAARAASIARTPTQARTAAEQALAADLTPDAGPCTRVTVTVDTSQFHAGGVVRATVDCQLDQSDLAAGLPLPGQRITATASAPIDVYRSVALASFLQQPAPPDGLAWRAVV
ncbi:hypothetical protein CC117_25680 [Parafrankia colletiae]|uniref:TadE-like domain-containing protein n=1 Tax=Parafrankia colletiae TaxID=573497 RepID=A0A1S1Q9S7_9ACTN|nr:TadE/TadG family type IV pilus assembly protein [Parafrankia colletiae]OHV31608.1 hypothetical protein CC117_25680 [Parafrankia colletiae]